MRPQRVAEVDDGDRAIGPAERVAQVQVVVLQRRWDAARGQPLGRGGDAWETVGDRGGLGVVEAAGVGIRQCARRLDERLDPADDVVGRLGEGRHAGREHGGRVVGEHLLHHGIPLHDVEPVRQRRDGLVVPHRHPQVGGRQPAAVAVDGERRGHGIRHQGVDHLDERGLETLRRGVLLDPHPTGIRLDPGDDRPEPHPVTDDGPGGAHAHGAERRHQPRLEGGQPLLAGPPGREVSLRHGAPRPTRPPRRSPARRGR